MTKIFNFKWNAKKLLILVPNMFFCIYVVYSIIYEYISALNTSNTFNGAGLYILLVSAVFVCTILSCIFKPSILQAIFGSLAFTISLFLFGGYVYLDLGFAHFRSIAYYLFALAYIAAIALAFIIIFALKQRPKIQFICEAVFFAIIAAGLIEVIIFENIFIYIPFLSHLTSAFCLPLCLNYWLKIND